MSQFSQTNRLLKISSAAFADNDFLISEFNAREALSSCFDYIITTYSKKNTEQIQNLIAQPAKVTINLAQQTRTFHGLIADISVISALPNGYYKYQFIMRPWLWFLNAAVDVEQFEQQSVIDIVTKLIKQYQFYDLNTLLLTKTYPKLDYVVQYNESTLDFIQRILAENSIYYVFETQDNKSILYLIDQFDQALATKTLTYSNSETYAPHIHQLTISNDWYRNKISSNDYADQQATNNLSVKQKQSQPLAIAKQTDFEHYYYPGEFSQQQQGLTKLKQLLQEHFSASFTAMGQSNVLALMPGYYFQLENNNKRYLLTSVQHQAHDYSYIPDVNIEENLAQKYHNNFTTIEYQNSLTKPKLSVTKPNKNTNQTAKIAAIADQTGKLKMQYYWQKPTDKTLSTHRLRVLQPVAGNQWGSQFLPRTDDEVLLHYRNGNPSNPIIIGALHNAARLPAFSLPNQQNQWGIISRSLRFIFDDTKQKELLTLQANNDFNVQTDHNATTIIKQNYSHKVANDYTVNNQSYQLHAKQHIALTAAGGIILMSGDKISIKGKKVNLTAKSSPTAKGILNDIADAALLVGGIPLDEAGVGEAMQAEAVADLEGEAVLKDLPDNPDDLVEKHGYEETSHPQAKEAGHRKFKHPKNGDILEHDTPKEGESGFRGKNHYHRLNPKKTSRRDWYLDKSGESVSKSSKASHLLPSGE